MESRHEKGTAAIFVANPSPLASCKMCAQVYSPAMASGICTFIQNATSTSAVRRIPSNRIGTRTSLSLRFCAQKPSHTPQPMQPDFNSWLGRRKAVPEAEAAVESDRTPKADLQHAQGAHDRCQLDRARFDTAKPLTAEACWAERKTFLPPTLKSFDLSFIDEVKEASKVWDRDWRARRNPSGVHFLT